MLFTFSALFSHKETTENILKNEKFRDELLTLDTAANIYSAFIEQDSRI